MLLLLVFLSDKLLAGRWQASSGDVVLLVAAAFFSAYTVQAKPLIEKHGDVTVMAYATLAASPVSAEIGHPERTIANARSGKSRQRSPGPCSEADVHLLRLPA